MPKRKRRKSAKPPDWKQFEIAVAELAKALDPSAKVTHNAKIPDIDTGEPRQRDVLIEALICQMYPVKVVVSCKRYKTTLNEKHIDDFIGELRSANANKGVIYSFGGFAPEAIAKAKKTGICCCCLYKNQPADLPELLIFGAWYLCYQRFEISIDNSVIMLGFRKWGDVYNVKTMSPAGDRLVFDDIVREWNNSDRKDAEERAKGSDVQSQFPNDWQFGISVQLENGSEFVIGVTCKWKFYEGKVEAVLLNGSYSITSGQFTGTQAGPVIDTQGDHPGPGWELIEGRPPDDLDSVACVAFRNDVKKVLTSLAEKPLPQLKAESQTKPSSATAD